MAIFGESEAIALLSSEAHGAGIVVCPSCGSSYTDVLRVGTSLELPFWNVTRP